MNKPTIHSKNQSGQAIVLIAIVMVALIASLGLALDGGGMFLLYRDVQNATDSAGLSAAFAVCSGGDYDEAARRALQLNGFEQNVDGVNITILRPPPTDESFAGDDDYVFIEVEAPKPSYFIQIVYGGPLEVTASTTALCDPGSDFGWPDDSAIVTLNTGCAAGNGNQAGVRTTGQGSFTTNNGGIYVNGYCPQSSVDTNGANAYIAAGGYGVCAQGPISGNVTAPENGDVLSDTSTPSCDVPVITYTVDPYWDSGLRPPTCTGGTGLSLSNSVVNQPGTYTNFDTNSGTYQLAPGIYCITEQGTVSWKGILRNESPTDGGVFLFFNGTDKVSSNGGNPDTFLHAMTDENSDYTGLLMWFHDPGESITNNSVLTFTANATGELTGTIYAPRKHCNLAGQAGTAIYAQIICWSFDANGGGGMVVHFDPSTIYEVPPSFGVAE